MNRSKGDSGAPLIVTFGVITALFIAPFALYRFLNGQTLIGLIDIALMSCIFLGSMGAVRLGRIKSAALLIALAYSTGCVAIAYLAGLPGLLWVYPSLVANFLLLRRWPAIIISGLAIAAVSASDAVLVDGVQKFMFIASSVVLSMFSYVFARRSELQRLQLEAIASRDPLTGADNRRGMHGKLEIAMATSLRNGEPLGLLVFDLDHFKRINDSFGHEAGDQVLVEVANLVRISAHQDDRFFRLGGEEFAVMVPGANPASLRDIAEKLREAVASEIQCPEGSVTISVGAAHYVPGESATNWLGRADAAMYRAKRNGRNCTVFD